MDLLDEAKALERIELLAKFVCVEESSAAQRQTALIWIGELAEQVRESVVDRSKKTTESRWF